MKCLVYIGGIAALGMAICDVILLGQPVSGHFYDLSSFGAIESISSCRANLGSTGGLIFAFFICFGFWYIKTLFDPINKKGSGALFISLCSVQFFGAAFHAAYFFLVPDAEHKIVQTQIVADFQKHLELLSYLGIPGFIISSVLFFWLGLDKRFSSWFRFCSPFICCLVPFVIFYCLPTPLGGYLRPTFINVGWFLMFTACLIATPRKIFTV